MEGKGGAGEGRGEEEERGIGEGKRTDLLCLLEGGEVGEQSGTPAAGHGGQRLVARRGQALEGTRRWGG